jgi:DNA helicase-2/ATP-dependent DNA helicase PcrA
VESFGSSYTTPGWQRAQAQRNRGQGGRGGGQAGGGFNENQSPFAGSRSDGSASRSDASGSRGDPSGFSRTKRGPMTIEGELIAKSTGTTSEFNPADRVFHQKFGYGQVVKVDGNKLTIAFEKAGEKKVVDSFVERV